MRRKSSFPRKREPKGVAASVCRPPPRPTLYLRPSPRVHHTAWPMSFGRPNAHPGPIRARYPEKSVTFPRHPCYSAAPTQAHTCPSTSPRLRHFSPPIRPNPATRTCNIRTFVLSSLTRGTDPAARNPYPHRRGIPCGCPASPVGALWQRRDTAGRPFRPLSCSATRRDTYVPNCPRRHYRIERDRRHSQLRTQQNVTESNTFRLPAKPVPVKACPEPAEWTCPEAPLRLP